MPIKKDGLTFSVILYFLFTAENIKIFNDYPQKVGSKPKRSERVYNRTAKVQRDFSRKGGAAKQTNTPSFRWGIVSGACSDVVETSGLEPMTPCMSSKYSNQLSYASVCRVDLL